VAALGFRPYPSSRTREALYNSWDKNDPKDAQVILHLKGGITQRFSDALGEGNHDFQELIGTYRRIVDRKVRAYHTLMTHYLPLYFSGSGPFIGSSRSEWFLDVFLLAHSGGRLSNVSQKDRTRR